METESIEARMLTLFAVMAVLALTTMALGVWWVMRRKGHPLH